MKNSKIQTKVIALAISFIVLITCFNSSIYGQIISQSHCFTIKAVAVTGSECATNTCGNPGAQCSQCIDVTITSDLCTGLNPTAFTVSSNSSSECHSICSPTNDFSVSYETCSWTNPRTIYCTAIADGHSATFRICHVVPGFTYTICLPSPTYCPYPRVCDCATVQF